MNDEQRGAKVTVSREDLARMIARDIGSAEGLVKQIPYCVEDSARAAAIARTKLDEALMWARRALQVDGG